MLNIFLVGSAVNFLIDLFLKNINVTNMRLTGNQSGRRRRVSGDSNIRSLSTGKHTNDCYYQHQVLVVIFRINIF